MSYHFANPYFFYLFLFLPIWFIWYFLFQKPKQLTIELSYNPKKLTNKSNPVAYLQYIPNLCYFITISLIIIALARPQLTNQSTQITSEGIDIIFVMDCSSSMETPDFQPNRLEVAKENALEFVNGRKNDRIGIVLFAEDAFSYSPLTLDYDLLKRLLKEINTNLLPKHGTAVGSAIAVGINRLRESNSPSKVIILITDGASNKGQIDPIAAAQLAAAHNIKIYSLAIGKAEYIQQQPFQPPQLIKADLDEKTLQEVATKTNGKFYRATNEQLTQEIFQEISDLEKTRFQEHIIKEVEDDYHLFLWTAFVTFTFAIFLTTFNITNWLQE